MDPANFIEMHWDLINWPTALVAVIILVPVIAALFGLIAKHSRELLRTEQEALERADKANVELTAQNKTLRDSGVELLAKIAAQSERELRTDVELSDEEQVVLLAVSEDRMNELYKSKKISDQRISLVQDRLVRFGFIAWGTMGTHAETAGREWLDAHDLLK